MIAITFDTLKYANRLKAAGVPDKQAEAMAEAQAEIHEKSLEGLATKADIQEVKRDIKELELRIATDIAPLKWGMAVCVTGIVALMLKFFFPH